MRRIIIVILFLLVAGLIFKIAPDYIIGETYEKNVIRVVLDDNEITNSMPQKALIINGKVMLSRATVDKYFDKYLYYDEKYNTIITTTDTMVSKLTIGENKIQINKDIKDISVPAQVIDGNIYIPIEELQDVYGIIVKYNEKVVITNKSIERAIITVGNDITVYKFKKKFSRIIDKVKEGEKIDIYGIKPSGWILVRTEDGNLGYVDVNKINPTDYQVQMPEPEYTGALPKINLVWEYAENYTPNRTGEAKIEGLNVVSPTWFYLKNTNGDVTSKIDKSYINWAHDNRYNVWAAFKNDGIGIEGTSAVITDMKKREKMINQIVDLATENEINGINVDFENMKETDINEYSQFIRELSAMLRNKGLTVSVDVTVPDGSPTWSLCYNRKELNDAVDYIILMAYDQNGVSSSKAGSVASLNWVEANIKKMLNLGVEKRKLILGIPFYSRIWTIQGDTLSSYTVGMQDQMNYLNMQNKEWLEDEGQYYVEYTYNNKIVKLWAEESESIAEKVRLSKEYELAGVAAWRRGYETENIWKVIKDNM